MAILQISKIQQRSGNLVDLPQLDEAEFGLATDAKRLFIGKTTPVENIEVLTSYSTIAFDQIDGAVGNLLINPVDLAVGQVLTYNGAEWVNGGGAAGGLITLGNVADVKIDGGSIGYVLETDGLGNLNWTPKGGLFSNIAALSNATPVVMTVANTTPYVNSLEITISGVNGASNTVVNGKKFFVELASDFPSSGNVFLYTDSGLTVPVVGTGLTYTNSPNAIATAIISGAGGSGTPGGANTSIQYNNNSVLAGDANLIYDFTNRLLALNGNANVGNLNANGIVTSSIFVSNVATGTAPLTVTSTTQVANLNAATAGLATYATTANSVAGANVSGAVAYATTANSVAGANVSGAVAYATTANSVAGANVSGAVAYATTANSVAGANVSGAVAYATTANAVAGANVSGQVRYAAAANSVAGANISGAVAYATTANAVAGANVSGTVANANNSNYLGTYAAASANTVNTIALRDANGNISANFFIGNGSQLTGLITSGVSNGSSNVTITANANVSTYVSGNATAQFVVAATGVNVAGTLTTTAITSGANTTAGTITGNWSLTAGSRLNATYADLAEYYRADTIYEPGTVLEFGGPMEVTLATEGTSRVAGVVSTNPAFAMNDTCPGNATAVALLGRVPCKVIGTINKGDLMVSAGNGYATASSAPTLGTVIGKALVDFDGDSGVIEVVVGRY
jgi:hypothetical protein